ncbi:MAG TPA: CoA pyrophosphatase [Solirubrobacterales bacterium]
MLLDPDEAFAMEAQGGRVEAAVLVPIYGWGADPGLVFTVRRHDLRRHAGEVSFPGGRRDPGESLVETALREAQEEIGLDSSDVRVVGALPPIGTFVTNFKVHPVVGVIGGDLRFQPNPAEVATVLAFEIEALRAGFAMRRLVRRGVPIRTPTYLVSDHLIWGATARILGELLERLEALGPATPGSAAEGEPGRSREG